MELLAVFFSSLVTFPLCFIGEMLDPRLYFTASAGRGFVVMGLAATAGQCRRRAARFSTKPMDTATSYSLLTTASFILPTSYIVYVLFMLPTCGYGFRWPRSYFQVPTISLTV